MLIICFCIYIFKYIYIINCILNFSILNNNKSERKIIFTRNKNRQSEELAMTTTSVDEEPTTEYQKLPIANNHQYTDYEAGSSNNSKTRTETKSTGKSKEKSQKIPKITIDFFLIFTCYGNRY